MANDVKKKILLVDDDEIHLTTAELFLKNDYEILKMHSGKEALEHLSGNEYVPDLVLLDIIMPNMDGWEVFRKFKEIAKMKNVPIVFLTAVENEDEKKKAFRLGIADFIHKPFNMTVLKDRVHEVFTKHVKK